MNSQTYHPHRRDTGRSYYDSWRTSRRRRTLGARLARAWRRIETGAAWLIVLGAAVLAVAAWAVLLAEG